MRSCRSPRERPEAGSSSISSFGSDASAIAIATCRCSPCERLPTSSESLWSIAARSAAARARSRSALVLAQRHGPQVAAADAERREIDAVLDADAEEHARLLIGARQPSLRAFPGRDRRDVLAEELDGAGRRGEVAGDDVEERGLAGAVRAEDGPTLAVSDVEVDVAHGEQTAEALADSLQAESRRALRERLSELQSCPT